MDLKKVSYYNKLMKLIKIKSNFGHIWNNLSLINMI